MGTGPDSAQPARRTAVTLRYADLLTEAWLRERYVVAERSIEQVLAALLRRED